jgi:hypothetical protein
MTTPPPPPPMPTIRGALIDVASAREALSRYIWNHTQLEDALRSAEYFIAEARKRIAQNQEDRP